MDIFILLVQIIVLFLVPLLASQLAKRFKAIRFVGPIILCYIAGIAMANIPGLGWDKGLAMTVSEIQYHWQYRWCSCALIL